MSAKNAQVPVLVFGHGITHLGVIRSFGPTGIPVYSISDQRDFVSASRYYRTFPQYAAARAEPGRLEEILAEAPLERAVLMPCTDEWVHAVACLPPTLAERFPTSMPPKEIIEAMVDKLRLANLLVREQVPHPRTVWLRTMEEAEALKEEAFAGAFLKPRGSQEFSRKYKVKAFAVKNRQEALQGLRRTLADGISMVLQEYIPGPPSAHHMVEGFVDRKGRMSFFGRRRVRVYPPDFGNSTYSVSVAPETMKGAVESLQRFYAAIGFRGMFTAEFKYDERDGQFKLLEINARAWWYADFAEYIGVPVCQMAYRDALGEEVEPVREYRAGKYCLHISQDYLAYRALKRKGQIGLGQWVKSWIGAHDAIFRLRDPGPALAVLLRSKERLAVHRQRERQAQAPSQG